MDRIKTKSLLSTPATWTRYQSVLWLTLILFLLVGCATRPDSSLPTSSPIPPTPTFASTRFGTAELDVPYCMLDSMQKMDVYYPSSGGPWPVFLYVHGGSWRELDKAEGEGWRYLNDSGMLVVSLNYRLAAYNVKFPAMIEDLKCAVRHLRANASYYNLDPKHIAVLGASAGGHLAALLGVADETAGWETGEYLEQSSRVQGVVDISGPTDLTLEMPDSIAMAVYYAFTKLPGTDTAELVAASPVSYVTPDDPPFLILQGNKDPYVPVNQAEALHSALTAAGIPSTLVVVTNGDHGLQGKDASPTQDEISEMILEFLVSVLLKP
jgi:acetyl esterase/lipase